MHWSDQAVFYHIYPIGFCAAEPENDFSQIPASRLAHVSDWIPHMKELGVNAVYFGPVFQSTRHGYDTADYTTIDRRLGENEDFRILCQKLHKAKIRVVLDGVLNHTGRDFWAFRDVREKKRDSAYCHWFFLDFGRDSDRGDGFYYEGWEGNYDLVRLNVLNPEVQAYLFGAITNWIKEFDIDGLRLDVAYCLPHDFIQALTAHCIRLKPDFFLLGEIIHGDYHQIAGEGKLCAATNYECYKGMYSSFNSLNLFEIAHSLIRQDGIYSDLQLYNFADNHDVSRLASILQNPNHLCALYTLLFAMPGIPSLYYGSEWGVLGQKENGDPGLRPYFEKPEWTDLTTHIAQLAKIYRESEALQTGKLEPQLLLTNKQYVFARRSGKEYVICALNAEDQSFTAHFNAGAKRGWELIAGKEIDFSHGLTLPPYGSMLIRVIAE